MLANVLVTIADRSLELADLRIMGGAGSNPIAQLARKEANRGSAGLAKLFALLNRMLPTWSIFTQDLRVSFKHWTVLVWLAGSIVMAVYWNLHPSIWSSSSTSLSMKPLSVAVDTVMPAAPSASSWEKSHSGREYLAEWSKYQIILIGTLIVLLGSSAISAEMNSLDESILCRGISRWQFLLAKATARSVCVLIVFSVLFGLLALGSYARWRADYTLLGVRQLWWQTGLVLAVMAWTSTCIGSHFRNPLHAFIVAWLILVGSTFAATYFSITTFSIDKFVGQFYNDLDPQIAPVLADTPDAVPAQENLSVAVSLHGFCLPARAVICRPSCSAWRASQVW